MDLDKLWLQCDLCGSEIFLMGEWRENIWCRTCGSTVTMQRGNKAREKMDLVVDRLMSVGIKATGRTSAAGVPHVVVEIGPKTFSICYFPSSKTYTVWWPWPSYDEQEKRAYIKFHEVVGMMVDAHAQYLAAEREKKERQEKTVADAQMVVELCKALARDLADIQVVTSGCHFPLIQNMDQKLKAINDLAFPYAYPK